MDNQEIDTLLEKLNQEIEGIQADDEKARRFCVSSRQIFANYWNVLNQSSPHLQ
ncbi:hypothetical protein [Candidatus Villigracilis saccharophilus]|uniref:hypothetical protein n=1 Tax=Candidatus Villigracilis saccharophilus TaxID=3140684 RepID=UPI0031373D7E|nr:hypothetical protein [Anaerolineales bacterium]